MADSAAPPRALNFVADRVASLSGARRPVIVALDGPVAVGKSTLARALAENLARRGLATTVVGADGFLLSNAELDARGLGDRKGSPESFDRPAMAGFLAAARDGAQPSAPAYDHAAYDASDERRQDTGGAAVVIFEGVNVLGADLAPMYDLRLYLDAAPEHVEAWFLGRFAATPFSPVRARALSPWRPVDGDPFAWGRAVWAAVNGPNWRRHIGGGRGRADIVLCKDANHDLEIV